VLALRQSAGLDGTPGEANGIVRFQPVYARKPLSHRASAGGWRAGGAFEALERMIRTKRRLPKEISLETHLVVRESTGPARRAGSLDPATRSSAG